MTRLKNRRQKKAKSKNGALVVDPTNETPNQMHVTSPSPADPSPVNSSPVNSSHGNSSHGEKSSSAVDVREEMRAVVQSLGNLQTKSGDYATEFVAKILEFADTVQTSDVHLQPDAQGLSVSFRNNGLLMPLGHFPLGLSTMIMTRLKVISNLLTYQNDTPQEGRIFQGRESGEVRVSTYPTLYGERAVLRFFGHAGDFQRLEDLGHTPEVMGAIKDTLAETSGAMIVSGPAGSGKSTTLYACLRELVSNTGGNRSLLTIEDPIEVPIPGVAQSQVNAPAGFDLHTGLKSLLRQDPEVIMIGEIRDPTTADIAIQASLTGQLMVTTFHADSASTSISRLLNLGVEPYLLRSGLIGVLSQRLLRVLCECRVESKKETDFSGLPIDRCWMPRGCDQCNHTGYLGRVITSEFLSLKDSTLADEIVNTRDSRAIYRIAVESGMKSLWERATELVREGTTSPAEVRRVLGISMRT